MENFNFFNPTEIIFGKDRENEVGGAVLKYGKKVLLHYGGGCIKKSGLYDRVIRSLNEHGVSFVELPGVQPNPRLSLVRRGIELCKKENIDFILAVGGGSVIDCCKVISAQALLDEDIWEMEYGKGQFPNAGIRAPAAPPAAPAHPPSRTTGRNPPE